MVKDDNDRPNLTLILGGKAAIHNKLENMIREDEVRLRESYRKRYGHEADDEWVLDMLAIKWGTRLRRPPPEDGSSS